MCKADLATYKLPKKILFYEEKNIPRSTTGKVQRHLVEDIILNHFKIKYIS